jgi:hypothetical protein
MDPMLDKHICDLQQRITELEQAIAAMKTAAIMPVLKQRLGITYDTSRCLWEFRSPFGGVNQQFVELDAAVDLAATWMARTSHRIDSSPANQSTIRAAAMPLPAKKGERKHAG